MIRRLEMRELVRRLSQFSTRILKTVWQRLVPVEVVSSHYFLTLKAKL